MTELKPSARAWNLACLCGSRSRLIPSVLSLDIMRAGVLLTETRNMGGNTGLSGKRLSSFLEHIHLEVPGKFQVKMLKQVLGHVHLDLEKRQEGRETGEFSPTARNVRPMRGDVIAEGETVQSCNFYEHIQQYHVFRVPKL